MKLSLIYVAAALASAVAAVPQPHDVKTVTCTVFKSTTIWKNTIKTKYKTTVTRTKTVTSSSPPKYTTTKTITKKETVTEPAKTVTAPASTVSVCPVCRVPDNETMANGGFEIVDNRGMPTSWEFDTDSGTASDTPIVSLAGRDEAHDGERALKIDYRNGYNERTVTLKTKLNLCKGFDYMIMFQDKDVGGCRYDIRVDGYTVDSNMYSGFPNGPENDPDSGTGKWWGFSGNTFVARGAVAEFEFELICSGVRAVFLDSFVVMQFGEQR